MLGRANLRPLRLPCCALLCGALCRLRSGGLEALVPGAVGSRGRHQRAQQRRPRTALVPPSTAVRPRGAGAFTTLRAGSDAAPQVEKAHVIAIATEYRQEAVLLQRAAQRLGYHFQLAGFREPWVGWGTKLIHYKRTLQGGLRTGSIAPGDPVLLIDGWDCMIVGSAQEFQQKMASAPYNHGTEPWYAGERICGPDFFLANRIDSVYSDPGTPWKYPNAGCMAARAAPALALIEDLLGGPSGHSFPEDGNDQLRLHEHLLELGEKGDAVPYFVDSQCGIFQCLYEAEPQWTLEEPHAGELLPRLRNKQTDERPVVLHGNGHTGRWFMSGLWRDMRYLERVGLKMEELAHLPFDGPVAPGAIPSAEVERNWGATFQLYRIIEKQLAYARLGITWDPWKEMEMAKASQ